MKLTSDELAAITEASERLGTDPSWNYWESLAFTDGAVVSKLIPKLLDHIAEVEKERDSLKAFFADTLPYLQEAWAACFNGEQEKLLSCEERGMGRLLAEFQAIADGKPPRAPNWITTKEASEQTEAAIAWATKLLGQPNALRDDLQRWMMAGETCADGIERADKAVTELEETVSDAESRANDLSRQITEAEASLAAAQRELDRIAKGERIESDGLHSIELENAKLAEEAAQFREIEAWVKANHNGYDPVMREAMSSPEPASILEAIKGLVNEAVEMQKSEEVIKAEMENAALRGQLAAKWRVMFQFGEAEQISIEELEARGFQFSEIPLNDGRTLMVQRL